MAMGRRRFDLDGRVIIIFVIVAIPFVAIGASLIVSLVRGSLREALGNSLAQRALETRVLLERYVADQTLHLRMLALDPQVRSTLATPAKELKADDEKRLEQAWSNGQDAKALGPFLSSPLAAHLREAVEVLPAIKLLQVIDSRGHLVASSARGARVLQSDAPWFRSLSAEGAHGAYIGDIHKPAGGDHAFLEIAYPVYHESEGRWLGAVRALIDATDIYGVLATVRVGQTGHAVLVRLEDGMILASDDPREVLTTKYPGFEVLQAVSRQGPFWTIPARSRKTADGKDVVEPARIVAYSDVEQIPNVGWVALVVQDDDESMKPVADVTRYLWLHFLGAFGTFVALSIYLSLKLKRPVIEEELHLHEEHVPQSMRRRRSDRAAEEEAS
jgi:hypothetical protein